MHNALFVKIVRRFHVDKLEENNKQDDEERGQTNIKHKIE